MKRECFLDELKAEVSVVGQASSLIMISKSLAGRLLYFYSVSFLRGISSQKRVNRPYLTKKH